MKVQKVIPQQAEPVDLQPEAEPVPEQPEPKNNSLTFKGNSFQFVENNLLFKENSRLLRHKWTLLEEEHIKDIDQSAIEQYDDKIDIYDKAILSLNGQDKKRKAEFIRRKEEEIINREKDLNVKSIRRLLKKRREFVLEDILTDMPFLQNIFRTIFTGDIEKLELVDNEVESITFVVEALNLFFSKSPMNKLSSTKF